VIRKLHVFWQEPLNLPPVPKSTLRYRLIPALPLLTTPPRTRSNSSHSWTKGHNSNWSYSLRTQGGNKLLSARRAAQFVYIFLLLFDMLSSRVPENLKSYWMLLLLWQAGAWLTPNVYTECKVKWWRHHFILGSRLYSKISNMAAEIVGSRGIYHFETGV
jgi:hypothetical protein